MTATLREDAVRGALVRAAVYETLALGFAYPEPEGSAFFSGVCRLARDETRSQDPRLAALLEPVLEAAEASEAKELAPQHTRLFAGEVPCSPHETEYASDPFSKTRQLADIAGFYHAFGVDVSDEHRTMADFIGTETEFMALLCRKEAHASDNGWGERQAIARNAQQAFLGAHLGRWTGIFCAELRRVVSSEPSGRLYLLLAEVLDAFVEAEVVRAGVQPVRLTKRMLAAEDARPPLCDPRVAGCMPQQEPT